MATHVEPQPAAAKNQPAAAKNQPSEAKQQTTAGNYFVANYPPFSFWTGEETAKVSQCLARPPEPDATLGLYVHLPFCRQRCHFCYFRVYTGLDAGRDRVTRYVDDVLRELDIYAAQPLIRGRKPRYVYFGGGTPSFLKFEQLEQLFGGLKERLPWDDVEEVTFECEPGTLNEKKLQLLRDLGVTRISLGVENFSDDILQTNGRGHLSKQVYRAYQWCRDLGFPQINIDLISGMLNETPENWHDCVRRAIDLSPDCITIYQMEIPFNTTIYKRMKDQGEIVAPVADWQTKRRWVAYAYEQLEQHGYTVTSAYTAVKDPQQYRFLYRDYLWSGADMISLGVASFGHFAGTHYQNEHHYGPYVERVERGELPLHRAYAMDEQERMLRELILQMKLGAVERSYFRDKFGVDPVEQFGGVIDELQEDGYLHVSDDGIVLHRDGLLRVDELLHRFFLPQHRGARYT